MAIDLPIVPDLSVIQSRLPFIFPEGTEHRSFLIRDMAAKTIFVMFYTGAVEGRGVWIRPNQVTKMTDEQAAIREDAARLNWTNDSLAPGSMKDIPNRWYAVDTREPIRDETLRLGLVMLGAVVERQGLPTTSSKPRYALNVDFARLFDPRLTSQEFEAAAFRCKRHT